jgi:hypothetical protein
MASSAVASADPVSLGFAEPPPVPMTPDATPMTPDEPSSEGSATRKPTRSTSTPPPQSGDNGATAFLIAGAVPFVAGAIQIPLGVGLAKANNDQGMNVAGAVQVITGFVGVTVGVPLLIIGSRRRARMTEPQEEEYALRVGPRGLSFRGSF